MAKGRIGLDIGSTAVRAVELVGTPLTVVRASQVALPPGAVESGEVREPAAVTEALRKLWSEGGFKGKQVWLGVGNQRVVVREISLPYLPGEGASRLARVPGAGIHPDAGRRRRARLPLDRRVRAGGPPDDADAPGRRATRHGRPGRAGRERRQARADGSGPDPVRDGALGGRDRWPARPRGGRGRGGDRRRRRARHQHRRARARGDPIRPDPAERWPRRHRGDRALGRRRGRRRRAPQARGVDRGRAGAPDGAAGCSATRRRVRRRGSLVARVLHGAGQGRADRQGARDGRRLASGRALRTDAPTDPGPG